MSDRSALSGAIALAFVAVAWGAIPLLVRNEVPSVALVGVRVTLGALALIGVAGVLGRLRMPTSNRVRVAVCGVLLAAHWITFFESIKYSSVAVALAILYLGPIAAAILSGPVLGEQVPRRLWLALAVAATGTLLVVAPWAGASDGAISSRGVAMALVSAALLTALLLVGKPAASSLGGLTMAIGELTVAAVVLAPATVEALTEYPEFLGEFLILGAALTGFAGFVYWEAMHRLPLATVSVIMYLEPASAVVWAAAVLDEIPDTMTWFGIALVVIGGVVAATASAQEEAIGAPAAL